VAGTNKRHLLDRGLDQDDRPPVLAVIARGL
jgi:hypothetical protein